MAKSSKEDSEFLMVLVGRPKDDGEENNEFANVFWAIVGIAIVTMIFVGLINEQELSGYKLRLINCPNRTDNRYC